MVLYGEEYTVKNMGLYLKAYPPKSTAEERIEKQIVPGRSGFLTVKDNSYEEQIKPVEFHMIDEVEVDHLKAWLTGMDRVIFSNQPDRYYKASIISKVDLAEIVPILHKGVVQFDCQPFGYLLDGEELIQIITPMTLYNSGTYESEPYLKVYGIGDIILRVNDQVLQIKGITDYVEIDTELDEIFKGTVSMENASVGDTPVLEVGDNTITWSGTITKLEIIPRWRCL